MEEEVDSDREEGPGHMLQTWLGELDTLKKASNQQLGYYRGCQHEILMSLYHLA
jgi:hypothetical protein